MTYIIRHAYETDDDGSPIFWSNDEGWVRREEATVFTSDDEPWNMIPTDQGEWVAE